MKISFVREELAGGRHEWSLGGLLAIEAAPERAEEIARAVL